MKYLPGRKLFRKWQAVITVLLFVFLGQFAWASVAEDIAAGKTLQDVIQASLDSNMELKYLIADLDAAGFSGSDSICGLFQAGQDHIAVIIAALDAGLSSSDVAGWADNCGATQLEIQVGYSMAGENLPAYYYDEYLYNPPSPSK